MNHAERNLKPNQRPIYRLGALFVLFLSATFVTYARSLPEVGGTAVTDWSTSWSMAGGNPERTSWTAEEVRGSLDPEWYKPIEPYIPQRVQIVAANNLLYIATSAGLYALDAATGSTAWIYPTEFPLGHSPTIANGVAYVGGFDHKIHAVNALTGAGIWTFEAGAGFQTSPLVVADLVLAGNRDGYFYAVHAAGANAGQLAWKYKTGGPILYSAAYKDGVVFFAANDSHAYALNATTGALVWKSAKLTGAGFMSYWPVVYQNRVIFTGSNNYRFADRPGPGGLVYLERDEIFGTDPRGTPLGAVGTGAGDWGAGTPTIDATAALQYFAAKPWRKTIFVLDRFTGVERETAPVLWAGNDGGGTRYPPVIGADGVLYQQNTYMADPYFPGGQISGWQPGNQFISIVSSDWGAVDEPHAAAAGGNLVYWNLCCDRQSGSFDVTLPNTVVLDRWNSGGKITGQMDKNREWLHFNYDLIDQIPGYNIRFYSPNNAYSSPYAAFRGPDGGKNGIYSLHNDVNPPIPYNGRLYMHRSNAIIAFAPTVTTPTGLPMATAVTAPAANITPPSSADLYGLLAAEVQKMLDAGHLRPGYVSHGGFDLYGRSGCGDDMVDYWHSSADTIVTLLNALPYLPPAMQPAVKTYLQSEFANNPPYADNHVGWRDGAARELFDLPPEVAADIINFGPEKQNHAFKSNGGWNNEGVWGQNPYTFYALWKYAAMFGDAAGIYAASKGSLTMMSPLPSDQLLLSMPYVHNAYIAGYRGFLELENLAGQPESTNIRNELNRLINLRVNNFTKDSAYATLASYCRTLNVSSNFMYLTPELADELRTRALSKVTGAINEYSIIAPYWFVTLAAEGYAENPTALLYDAHDIFMARAWILQESSDSLVNYLDVPAFYRGDLFYIDKLVALLGEPGAGFTMSLNTAVTMSPGETRIEPVEITHVGGFTETVTLATASPSANLTAALDTAVIAAPGGQVHLTLTDTHTPPMQPGQWFTVPITATAGTLVQTVNMNVLIGGSRVYLPVTFKN